MSPPNNHHLLQTFYSLFSGKQNMEPQNQTLISIPDTIPEDILTQIIIRLPIKTIIQLKSLSKHHLNLITSPSFTKLQFNHAITRTPSFVFISAYNTSTRCRHFLALSHAPSRQSTTSHTRATTRGFNYSRAIFGTPRVSSRDTLLMVSDGSDSRAVTRGGDRSRGAETRGMVSGDVTLRGGISRAGKVTHLVTIKAPIVNNKEMTESECLNGLILFNSGNGFIENNYAFIVNPSTREIVRLNPPGSRPVYGYGNVHMCYFFGFDEVANDHKVLNIRTKFRPSSVKVMLFSLGSGTWTKIDAEFPFDVSVREGEENRWLYGTKHGVCVNSVIFVMLQSRNEVLAFDLRNERFEMIELPREVGLLEMNKRVCRKGLNTVVSNQPFLMKINGLLSVVCYDRVTESDEMHVWKLVDYEKRVWVRESTRFCKSWFLVNGPFSLNPYFKNDGVVPIFDVESKSVKEVEFTFGHQFLCGYNIRFDHVRSYGECILPLKRSEATTS